MIKVQAIRCADCGDLVYSRARHDFRSCTCRRVFVDGGLDYRRVGYTDKMPERVELEVEATREELYRDWNERRDRLGLVRSER